MEKTELETKFETELHKKIIETKILYGYNATAFTQMLQEKGGVNTAKTLIAKEMKGVLSDGFVKVAYELNRKDLTMEDSVIKEEYQNLFTEDEVEFCKRLLDVE